MKLNKAPLSTAVQFVIDHRGLTPKKLGGDWAKSGYRALSAKNIKTGEIVQKESIRYVSPNMYKKWMPDEIRKNDIIITSEAPFGEVLLWDSDEKIVLSQRIFGLRIKNDFDPVYLYYYMCTKDFQGELNARASGTTVTGLRQPELLKCLIIYPNLDLQNKIGRLLKTIDEKISSNHKINDILQQQAFTIFDKLFHGYSDGDMLIGDYVMPKRGKSLLSKNAMQGNVPVIAGGLQAATYHNIANTIAPVITISASGANAGYVNLWYKSVWSSDSSFIDLSITSDVLFWYVLLKKRQKEIFDAQTGSAQPHVYPQHIASMRIPTLNNETIKKYVEQVSPLFNQIGANISENSYLASLRDTLLPKLMSGEIDVSNIEI